MQLPTILLFHLALVALTVSTAANAQIYKWIDAKGVTHYSKKKDHANAAKADELKIRSQPTSAARPANSSAEYWQDQDRQFKQRQAENSANSTDKPSQKSRPRSVSGGRSDDTASSKCNLARDVLNGSLRHSNGAPVDKYDRETAENDVKAFCR